MLKKAVSAIDKAGILLVYPIRNQKEPKSLWYELFPRTKMVWEWDDESDSRVADVWHLREELSRSNKVVYAKWFQNRATFFSKEMFSATLRLVGVNYSAEGESRELLSLLEETSPQSTKELKAAADLEGKFHQPTYEKAVKKLWSHLQIVGYGERDDGAFPSLLMGATRHLFEDLWNKANLLKKEEAERIFYSKAEESSFFSKWLKRLSAPPEISVSKARRLARF